jgi:catechol 2,3-dioxygenase-like lactoylglutathione lyase family enzyme
MSEVCGITSLFHVLVKTNDLAQTLAFYKGILGLREAPRPPMGNPGAWLAVSSPVGDQVIHIWSGGAGMGPTGVSPYGMGTIDHVSFIAFGHEAYRNRFEKHGLAWREFIIPQTTLWQLFVYDPSGVQLELTFEAGIEGEEKPDMSPGRKYIAGTSFFDKASYPKLAAPA